MGKTSNEIAHSMGEPSSDKLRFVFVHSPVNLAFNEKLPLGANGIFAGWKWHNAPCGQPLKEHYSAMHHRLPASRSEIAPQGCCPSPS